MKSDAQLQRDVIDGYARSKCRPHRNRCRCTRRDCHVGGTGGQLCEEVRRRACGRAGGGRSRRRRRTDRATALLVDAHRHGHRARDCRSTSLGRRHSQKTASWCASRMVGCTSRAARTGSFRRTRPNARSAIHRRKGRLESHRDQEARVGAGHPRTNSERVQAARRARLEEHSGRCDGR